MRTHFFNNGVERMIRVVALAVGLAAALLPHITHAGQRVAFSGIDKSTAPAGDKTRWAYTRTESTRPYDIVGTSASKEGTKTMLYFNCDDQLMYKKVEWYSGDDPVKTSRWLWTYNVAGRVTREATPDSLVSVTPNPDGTFIESPQSTGLIKEYSYEGNSLLTTEKVRNGSSSPVTTTEYVYWQGTNPSGSNYLAGVHGNTVRYVKRYPDPSGTAFEMTEYKYPSGFHDSAGLYPKLKETRVYLNGDTQANPVLDDDDPYIATFESYNTDGSVQFSKDAQGVVTFNQYYAPGDTSAGAVGRKLQYSVKDINTNTAPEGVQLPSTIPSPFDNPYGTNLKTEYTYNATTGKLCKVISPEGQITWYIEKLWDSTNDSSGTHRSGLPRAGTGSLTTGTLTYPRVLEQRAYPLRLIESNYEIVGPIQVTYSIGREGKVISNRQATMASLNLGTSGPSMDNSLQFLTWSDTYLSKGGQVASERVYLTYNSGTVNTGGAYAETAYAYDAHGRVKTVSDPDGRNTHYTHNFGTLAISGSGTICFEERRVYPHEKSGGPIQVTWTDEYGRTIRNFGATSTSEWVTNGPTGSEALSEVSRATYAYDWRGRLETTRTYFRFTEGSGTIGLGGDGTISNGSTTSPETGNYYERKVLAIDNLDRVLRQKDGMGNITATVYDLAGREVSQWLGTDDGGTATPDNPGAGTSNLEKIAETIYPNADGANLDLASQQLKIKPLSTLAHTSGDFTATDLLYDSLGRTEWVRPALGPWAKTVYDNAGRVQESLMYLNGGTTTLLAKTTRSYDAAGRLSAVKTFEVTSGSATANHLLTSYGYDAAGRQAYVTRPQGGYDKQEYDAAGRVVRSVFCADSSPNADPSYGNAVVLTETVNEYTAAGDLKQVTRYARNHNLGMDTKGLLSAISSSSRVTTGGTWYDSAHRPIASADCGTGSFTWTSTVPQRSDTVLVTSYSYGDDGQVSVISDPNDTPVKTFKKYDALGRPIVVQENYTGTNGAEGTPANSTNRTTKFTYNADSNTVTQTAAMPSGTPDQVTKYVYASELNDKGCPVKSNSYLRGIIYPDSTNTVSSNAFSGSHDRVELTYNANSSLATKKDQRSSVITYTYDAIGRLTQEAVSGGGTGGNQVVIYDYDSNGRLKKAMGGVTSAESDLSGAIWGTNSLGQFGGVFNQYVADIYPNIESPGIFQSLYYSDGTVGSGTLSNVLVKGNRPTYMRRPGGYKIFSVYDGHNGIDDAISRVNKLGTGTGTTSTSTLVEYNMLGDGMLAQKSYPQPQLRLDYTGGTSGYGGYDEFNRIKQHKWVNYAGTPVDVFNIGHEYDRNSNRLFAENTTQKSASQSYTYDGLNRLTEAKAGAMGSNHALLSHWQTLDQPFILDALGNQTGVDRYFIGTGSFDSHFKSAFDSGTLSSANEITSRRSYAQDGVPLRVQNFGDGTSTLARFETIGSESPNSLTFSNGQMTVGMTLVQDTDPVFQVQEPNAMFVSLYGQTTGPFAVEYTTTLPSGATSSEDQTGIIFGYKDSRDYWLHALCGDGYRRLYHVQDGQKTVVGSAAIGVTPGSESWDLLTFAGKVCQTYNYQFAGGFPSGRMGVFTTKTGTKFHVMYIVPCGYPKDLGGRWINPTAADNWANYSNGFVDVGGNGRLRLYPYYSGGTNPVYLRGLKLQKFRATFATIRDTSWGGNFFDPYFVFNGTDMNNYEAVCISNRSAVKSIATRKVNEGVISDDSTTGVTLNNLPYTPDGSTLWCRVENNGTTVTLKTLVAASAPSDSTWDGASACLTYSNFTNQGGLMGFCANGIGFIDNLTIESWDSTYNYWTLEHADTFTCDANGFVSETPTYDAAGNLTYDGVSRYTYDAWNRLLTVAHSWSGATADFGQIHTRYRYDGLGRRISKQVTGTGAGDFSEYYLYDGISNRVIETRNGSGEVVRGWVWGRQYIDELVAILRNDNYDEDSTFDAAYFAAQDANYNVLGVFDSSGELQERYEYSPYGQRTVLFSGGSFDEGCYTAALRSVVPANHYAGLCDIGHQGLMHDEESGLIYNRARTLHPQLGRFMQRDPAGYVDSMQGYEYVKANPLHFVDPTGLDAGWARFGNGDPWSRECSCGPNVDNLLRDLLMRTVRWKAMITAGKQPAPGYWAFYKIGMTLDWSTFTSPACPAEGKCAATYTLCGECVHDHWIGNFMYGFLGEMLGIGRGPLIDMGQFVQQRGPWDPGTTPQGNPIDYLDPPWDKAGYTIGWNFWQGLQDPKVPSALLSTTAMCSALKQSAALWNASLDLWPIYVNDALPHNRRSYPNPRTNRDYQHCKPCNAVPTSTNRLHGVDGMPSSLR